MSIFRKMVYGSAPKVMVFKRNAHLCTLMAAAWFAFSLLGVFLFKTSRGPDARICVIVAVAIWCLHVVLIGLSIYFWMTEKPKEMTIIETEPDIGF
ncbi:MAG TPA: hypothetical protein VN873_11040 [Candidatus Angelobacter sp.]|nr:hypothetical protein [Candidatus Angelobacter sp.]